ncbi:101aa long hypothetical protein [Pyrococcus horikoshii OT3]|uniref:Uncharacterized protein n=1 Tax=Pyrococcus horikoshii (strain ATCC 700860 / DSM 12428 / JCM 9974 / NBRC 100139 / OT-3) TaxID=70601 RepID=O58999_PYRHO|nr:101aa long hypothetical protein [Pyrococcus horikoshii OT3]
MTVMNSKDYHRISILKKRIIKITQAPACFINLTILASSLVTSSFSLLITLSRETFFILFCLIILANLASSKSRASLLLLTMSNLLSKRSSSMYCHLIHLFP